MNHMKHFMGIIREAVADEYSIKGHGDIKIRRNDPRFSDNPLAYGENEEPVELDEFDSSTTEGRGMIDRLHDLLHGAGVGDPEIKLGIQLTPEGVHKIAARLGNGPDEVTMLLASLKQELSDQEENSDVAESYRQFMETEMPDTAHPFKVAADEDDEHFSAETDYLGDVTVRSSKRAKEKYFQGSQAASITAKLKSADDETKADVLRPLIEDDLESGTNFRNEIMSDSGTYNFPWKLDGHTGFGTVLYSTAGDHPQLKLISVRDGAGDDVDINAQVHKELLLQAEGFIGDA